ncbi:MAG: outer membrane assembly protein AsmA [Pantoea sp.]|uniref:outer membrane assembly protein AsmA n=2 Tax=Pantoea TaxID=53335 RepID=UPI0029006E98|nr:outer membrane assembly protein AsmA [Pantoea sp.]MDU1573900.1 outer membrane assembly protein AsmA [Pantoea sp.]
MKRVITTLAILLVVIVAGMTALVLLVNPNDFRSYMVKQVEQRSGYRLEVSGDLRWHVWPKLSILAGRMSLTAPGASQPLVTAENMRLDVNLWPLLSHQLSVSQVMLSNAVVRATPESAPQQPQNAPVAPGRSDADAPASGWSFDISQLRVADSLLIWRQPGGDEYNFRNLNLNLNQDARHLANIELSTSLTRNQRNAVLSLKGQLDASQYPHRLSGKIDELNYALSGANMPPQGIKGTLSAQGSWRAETQQFALTQMQLSANDSALSGEATGSLTPPQQLALQLHATQLNLDNLMANVPQTSENGTQHATVARAPVIAAPRVQNNLDSPLNDMNLAVNLKADSAVWRGLSLQNFALDVTSQQGLIALRALSGKLGDGDFSVPGSVDIRQPETRVALQPVLNHVAIQPLLAAFDMPQTVQGAVSLKGDLSGEGLSLEAAKRRWRGEAQLNASDVKLAQLNLQQMVRRAVARASDRVSSDESADQGIRQLSGTLALNNGVLHLANLQGEGDRLKLQGGGEVNMPTQQLDVTFGLTLTGWKGDDKVVALLSQQAIPLRMYGSWNNVQYSLPVDQVLRQQLQSEAKSRLNQWLDRQPKNSDNDSLRKLLRP